MIWLFAWIFRHRSEITLTSVRRLLRATKFEDITVILKQNSSHSIEEPISHQLKKACEIRSYVKSLCSSVFDFQKHCGSPSWENISMRKIYKLAKGYMFSVLDRRGPYIVSNKEPLTDCGTFISRYRI